MIILALRTDKPEAELYLYDGHKKLSEVKWQAHRQLAETIHIQIQKMLDGSSILMNDVRGMACFRGPGSFTGLRIGLSVANALAYSLEIPVVTRRTDNWLKLAIDDLLAGKNEQIAIPFYGRPANTTQPRK
ncbi:MAG TPA: tRNA (adenosine(37)-N6)-threonylcarbamoyltransferase complex dimerization subunit type 1 TsaB [Candidatus Saccharimonadales bacterium]|nr:tRNA (adenosine(37)-N6)-threonylcarbamoyltransferase complex dimerization subunit type 1 TsaB [Candidatus Saccharimonadales bacterium]